MGLKNFVLKAFYKSRNYRIINSQKKKFKHRMNAYPGNIMKLSKEQKTEIQDYYMKYNIRTDTVFHEFVSSINKMYSPLYVNPGTFFTVIGPALNDGRLSKAWADKNYYDLYFPEVRFPKTLVRCISGEFYSSAYKPIKQDSIMDILSGKEFVAIKPSIDSGGGNAVKKLKVNEDLIESLQPYIKEGNFVIQELICQHTSMAALNESSVNIVRIISLLLDGEVKIATAAVRVGAPGKFNDNYIDDCDRSMLTIGVDSNGYLKEKAFFASGESVTTCLNGYDFKGKPVVAYHEMLEIVNKIHPQMGHFKMISWDFFVAEDGHASVMELNLNWAGIAYYQYVNGPLFGEYTDRVLEYVASQKEK